MSTDHKHSYDITRAKEIKVPLAGGNYRHTSFMLLECECGKKICFPDDNFRLAINEGTEQTKKYLESLGV